ncbi:MAG: hypothetical protein K2X09_04705 [Rickettsiales bacterium]|nr:hypothetical protein [Rickettsiales bacterium]
MTETSQSTNAKPVVTAPIPDVNRNGVLDGKDLLAQMRREEKNGSGRTPSERAHGVLFIAQAYALTLAWNGQALQIDPSDLPALTGASANVLRKNIAEQITAFNANPNHANALHRNINASPISASEKALFNADVDSFAAFAATFKTQFPKGIKIDRTDMPEILGHFGPLIIPAPTPPAPRQQPREPRTIA